MEDFQSLFNRTAAFVDKKIYIIDEETIGDEMFFEVTIATTAKELNYAKMRTRYAMIHIRCFHCLDEYGITTDEGVKQLLRSLNKERFMEVTTPF